MRKIRVRIRKANDGILLTLPWQIHSAHIPTVYLTGFHPSKHPPSFVRSAGRGAWLANGQVNDVHLMGDGREVKLFTVNVDRVSRKPRRSQQY